MKALNYRFSFFDEASHTMAALFMINYATDADAITEAKLLLPLSSHNRIEVWQGSRLVYAAGKAPAVPQTPPEFQQPTA